MKVLVCGSRHCPQQVVIDKLNELSMSWPKTKPDDHGNWLPAVEIISGAAKGADTAAVDWAVINWCKFTEFPAKWDLYGRRAGPIRNQQMLDEGKPDLVVAFLAPDSRGTKDMIKRAQKAGVEVLVVDIGGINES